MVNDPVQVQRDASICLCGSIQTPTELLVLKEQEGPAHQDN